MITITDSVDVKQWGEFVYNHPRGNIFQMPEIAEIYRRTKNYTPISLAALDSDGKMLAILSAVIIKEMGGFLGSFSARSVIQGGPLFIDGDTGIEALGVLMGHYDKIAKNNVLYTQIRNMWDTTEMFNVSKSLGYSYVEHLNFLISTDKSEDEIWGNIHKSRRKGINRAKKMGVTVEVMNIDDLQTFYDIVHDTYRNVNLPVADISLFESVYDLLVPNDMARFYLARCDGEYIGARAVLKFKGFVHDWYAGSLSQHSTAYVNEAMVWHILKESANSGYSMFDFGGAGNPDKEYGVREFKRRFGGELVNFGRYEKNHAPLKTSVAKFGFNIYKKMMM